MHRRALLVAVAGLSGCTGLLNSIRGGGGSGGGNSGGGGGATPTPEADGGTPTATPTPAPTEEPLLGQSPSDAELSRMGVDELIALARDRTEQAVVEYTGEGQSLSAVSAASSSFDPSPVITHLYEARRAYEAANRQGISTANQTTINRLRRADELLRKLIDAQVLHIEAHSDLEQLAAAIERVDSETAGSLWARVGDRQEEAQSVISLLSEPRYERSLTVVEQLSETEYSNKRVQMNAESTTLARLVAALTKVLEGVRTLARAKGRKETGAPYAAAELAREAETVLRRGRNELDSVDASIGERSRGFSDVSRALLASTGAAIRDARELYEGIA